MDHFGYGVPTFCNWSNEIWYDQKKFEEWFEIQRERRRNRDIMPHMDPDDDSDSPDDDSDPEDDSSSDNTDVPPPPESSPVDDNGEGQGPSSGQDNMDNQPDTLPDTDGGAIERSPDQQVPPSQGPVTSIISLPLRDLIPNADFIIVIDGVGGVLGSYDQKFEFVNWGDIIPFNPYAFCSGLSSMDFESRNIYDPRTKNVKGIINILTRGKHPFSIEHFSAKMEDEYFIKGQLPLPGLARYLTTKRFAVSSVLPNTNPKRPRLTLQDCVTYTSWTRSELTVGRLPTFYSAIRRRWPKITPPSFVVRPEHRPQSPVPKFMADLADSIQETI